MARRQFDISEEDAEVLALIEHEEEISYGINDSQLSDERATALDYYLGKPFGNEIEGRSQVVSFDVQDTVEAALPQLLKIFTSGDQVVRFDPKEMEDEDASEQETDYINHVVMEQNDGFSMFYTWFKDALISKNGYVKVYYEEQDEVSTETYQGITDSQLMQLVNDDKVTVIEHQSFPDPSAQSAMQDANAAQMMQAGAPVLQIPMLHYVKIELREKKGKICIDNVAPEDIKVSVDARGLDLQQVRFVQHCRMMGEADLKEMGIDVPEGLATDNSLYEIEANARDLYSEDFDRTAYNAGEFLVKDTYLLQNGKRMRYLVASNYILLKEDCEIVPFVSITPMLMPHRHIGRSYADLTMDIQLVKSTLIRGQLDNMYLSNNGRYAISDRVNLEDMLTSRPGGVVRVQGEPSASIMPLQHVPFPPVSFTMVEYMDTMKEKRTGITSYNQGLDSESLNKTATGITAIMNAAAMRLELVARLFAETGVKQLFLMVHRMVRKYYTKPDIIRLRNKWVEVDPRTWANRKDMTINVGLGTGNRDAQLSHLMTILAAQKEAMAGGLSVVNESNLYNALVKLTQNAGFKHPELFWTDPKTAPPKQQQEAPEITIKKMELQSKENETGAELKLNAATSMADQRIKESELVIKSKELQIKEFDAVTDRIKVLKEDKADDEVEQQVRSMKKYSVGSIGDFSKVIGEETVDLQAAQARIEQAMLERDAAIIQSQEMVARAIDMFTEKVNEKFAQIAAALQQPLVPVRGQDGLIKSVVRGRFN